MTRTSIQCVLALAAAAVAVGMYASEQVLPFASASSLVVEKANGKMAYVQGSTLYVLDPARPDATRAAPVAASNPIVVDYRGQHILVSVNGGEGDPGQLAVFHEGGEEAVRLPRGEGNLAYPGAGAALSVDGSVVWERASVDGPTKALLQLSPEIPDGTTVVVSLDLTTGARRVAVHTISQGSKAELRVSDIVMLGAQDFLMTLWGGAVMRLRGSKVVWQRAEGGERPWRLFDVHAGRDLILLGDDTRGLRVLRLADGAELASWQFAKSPERLERFLEERLGREHWQGLKRAEIETLGRSRLGERRGVSGPGCPVDEKREERERVFGVRSARFLPDGMIWARGPGWVVFLDLTSPDADPLDEVYTHLASAELKGAAAFARTKGLEVTLRQVRVGESWQLVAFDGSGWHVVPASSSGRR